MDFKRLEDGNRQIIIGRNETQDFEICMCGEGGLYLAADKKHLKIFRHTPSRAEDPYQPLCQIELVNNFA